MISFFLKEIASFPNRFLHNLMNAPISELRGNILFD